MFRFEQIDKRYGDVVALHGVDLTLTARQTHALIGPSGAGKSTLLRLLLGLDWPDAGRLLVNDLLLERRNLLDWRRRVGYAIQEGGLFPHLSAYDNAALVARLLGWDERRIDARIAELVTLMQLPEGAIQRFPAALSGGQRQRAALIRALMLDPEVLLLDEPLGALDPVVRRDLQEQLKSLFATLGKTVVLVTHDVAEACFLADHMVLLMDGAITQQGSPRDLLDSPCSSEVAAFLRAQRGLPA